MAGQQELVYIGVDIGGTRGAEVKDPYGNGFSVPLDSQNLQENVDDGIAQMAEDYGYTVKAAGWAVDGKEMGITGAVHSFKADEVIDPGQSTERHGWRAVAVGDTEAIAYGLSTVETSEMDHIIEAGREISDGFPLMDAVAITVSTGVGAAKRSGRGHVINLLSGHLEKQASITSPYEFTIQQALAQKALAERHNEIVTVEQVLSGGQVLEVVEAISPAYARKLQAAYEKDPEVDYGKIIADDAAKDPDSIAADIMLVRADMLGTFVHSLASEHGADVVALTGGVMKGLKRWLRDPRSEFVNSITTTNPKHYYTVPEVIAIPEDGIGMRGALRLGQMLMEAEMAGKADEFLASVHF